MPNSASAAKRVRQNARRRARNLWRKRRVKDQVKAVMAAVTQSDVKTADEEFRKACRLLDQVAAKGTIHRNAAARRKSRLSKRVLAIKKAGGR